MSMIHRVGAVRWLGGRLLLGILLMAAQGRAADPVDAAQARKSAPKSGGIRFSHSRGFHDAPFDLVLSPGEVSGEIRYTLDGSAPGAGRGEVYRKPVRIDRTSVVRAAVVGPGEAASRPQTHTYVFLADVVRQSPDGLPPAGWPYAWGDNVVDYGMDPSVVDAPETRDRIVPALRSLPTYSLVMDLDDLFDPRRGIYANSGMGGREWERPASLELILPSGKKGFQEECGVRIRGGFSSGGFNPKHAFRLFFRKEYGAGKLKYPVFGGEAPKEFDGFDLRCAQNYSWHLGGDARGLFLRDQFSRDLQRGLGQPAARGDYCHLYLNGQYWGLYNTCERPEASYAASLLGGGPEDYDVIKTGGVGQGMALEATDGSMDAWRRLHGAAKAGLADNAAYFRLLGCRPDGTRDPELEVLLDPGNLIDYLLVIWYAGNFDAPVTRFSGNRAPNNWHGFRPKNGGTGFKFFIWDAEHSLLDVEEDRTGPFPSGDTAESSHPQWLFQQCVANAEFRVLLADRIHRHLAAPGGVLTVAGARERFEARVREIEEAVIGESARWGDVSGGFGFGPPGGDGRPQRPGPDGQPRPVARSRDRDWRPEVRRILEDYLPKRTEVVLFQLWRQGLVSDVPAPRFEPVAGGQGEMRVSVEGADEVWSTVDGSDPRTVGGAPGPGAVKGGGPRGVPAGAVLSARARRAGEWGPLVRSDAGARR